MVPRLLVLLLIVGLSSAHPRPQDESDADNVVDTDIDSLKEAIALELQKDEEDPNNVVDAIKGLLTNIANVETADRLEGSNDVVIVQYVEGDLLSSEDGSGQEEEVENEESSVEVMSVPPEVDHSGDEVEESSVDADATDTDTR